MLLTKNGPLKITNSYFDPSVIQSDKKIEDEEILKLLSSPLRKNKKKKKSGKGGAEKAEKEKVEKTVE